MKLKKSIRKRINLTLILANVFVISLVILSHNMYKYSMADALAPLSENILRILLFFTGVAVAVIVRWIVEYIEDQEIVKKEKLRAYRKINKKIKGG